MHVTKLALTFIILPAKEIIIEKYVKITNQILDLKIML